jgi:hypothetical protein
MATSGLGDFLRGRRATTSPADVGLVAGSGRRVSGLRREEVAVLVGVSVDYYDARLHLFRLAGAAPGLRATGTAERVDPSLRQLLDGWPDHPALVLGRHYDVLARNRIGRALFAPFTYSDDLLLNMFLDPAASFFYVHHRAAAVNTVAGFRLTSVAPHDPRTVALVEQLHAASPEFREIWRRTPAASAPRSRPSTIPTSASSPCACRPSTSGRRPGSSSSSTTPNRAHPAHGMWPCSGPWPPPLTLPSGRGTGPATSRYRRTPAPEAPRSRGSRCRLRTPPTSADRPAMSASIPDPHHA